MVYRGLAVGFIVQMSVITDIVFWLKLHLAPCWEDRRVLHYTPLLTDNAFVSAWAQRTDCLAAADEI